MNVDGTGGLCAIATVTVTVYGLPAAAVNAMVPVMWPVVGLIESPAGRPRRAVGQRVDLRVRGRDREVDDVALGVGLVSGLVTTGGLLLGALPVVKVQVGLVRSAIPSLVTAYHS